MPDTELDRDEVDVLIVGGGCAGMSAAIEAGRIGRRVLVVERSSAIGGASAMAGGLIYLGGGTGLQAACGVQDSPEEMYKYLMAATGPGADERKVTDYSEGSREHFDWLVECGVPFKESIYSGLLSEPPGDDGLMYSGGESAYPFADIARPAQRGHVPRMPGTDKVMGERGSGWMLMQCLGRVAIDLGVEFLCDARATKLVTNGDGSVQGAQIRSFGKEIAVTANGGVVLAGGGFAFSPDMVGQHAPRLAGHSPIGTDHDDGGTIRLAQAVGAASKHMSSTTAYAAMSPLLVRSIVVNGHGMRFINEDQYFGRVGEAAFFGQEGQAFVVYDQEGFDSIPEEERMGMVATHVCETVDELESELGIAKGALECTLELFNRYAKTGEDPVFHKDPKWVRPLVGPYGALDLRQHLPGDASPAGHQSEGFRYSYFTLGGLSTSVDGEVFGVDGDPIPGLFAAGRTTSGIPANGYASGCSIGDGTFFGRRAGRAAATRTKA
jgi:3-oxo-5alpha-steroid 4-dehydrogenase